MVEQLVAKTDVKARVQAKASGLTQRAKDATSQVRRRAATQAGSARKPLTIAAGVLIAGAVAVRIWKRVL